AANDFITPIAIPDGIALVNDPPVGIAAMASTPSTGIRSLLGNLPERPDTPLTPPPPPPARPVAPIRVGTMERANLIRQVMPQYPALARQVRVQGAVVLEATIDKDGTVRDLRVISGHPLLVEAAVKAVQQWKYKPTILN